MFYNNYTNPYVLQAQQRMMQYEQQYPQFNNQNMIANQQFLKGRAVTSEEEVRACPIDFDGSIFVFTDIANKKIYTKQIDLNGRADLKVYKLVEEIENKNISNINNINDYDEIKNSIELLNKNILDIKNKLESKEVKGNVQSNSNASNAKKQSQRNDE